MYAFLEYYNNVVKYDLINKFWYLNLNKIPKLNKIVIEFNFKGKSNTKELTIGLLALELISLKKGQFVISKKSNISLKIRKGYPIGCKVVLQKKFMYDFLTKLILEIFPKLKTLIQIKKRKRKCDHKIAYKIKNSLLFLELEHNYDVFETNVKELNLTFITSETTQKELYYLMQSFKQPFKTILSK